MKQRVLVVESPNAKDRRTSCGAMVDDTRFLVDIAPSGAEALSRIFSRPPDLAIIDARAAVATTIEWCRRIKQDSLTRDVKVILLIAASEWGRVFEALAAGCDDYLVEPFDRRELELKMKELLKFSHLKSDISRAAAVVRA